MPRRATCWNGRSRSTRRSSRRPCAARQRLSRPSTASTPTRGPTRSAARWRWPRRRSARPAERLCPLLARDRPLLPAARTTSSRRRRSAPSPSTRTIPKSLADIGHYLAFMGEFERGDGAVAAAPSTSIPCIRAGTTSASRGRHITSATIRRRWPMAQRIGLPHFYWMHLLLAAAYGQLGAAEAESGTCQRFRLQAGFLCHRRTAQMERRTGRHGASAGGPAQGRPAGVNSGRGGRRFTSWP